MTRQIRNDFALSLTAAGLLTTIPLVCMGVFAIPAARLYGSTGARAAVALALSLVAVAGILRALSGDAFWLFGLTLLYGVGAGLAGGLFPAIVKQSISETPALATGIYSIGINAGAGIAAALAVHLMIATGGWRGSLAIYGLEVSCHFPPGFCSPAAGSHRAR